MQRDSISFLTAGDAGVSWGLVAAVGSLLRVLPYGQRFSITVIDGGFPEKTKRRLGETTARMHGGNGVLRFVPFRWPADCRVPSLGGSLLTYARFFVTKYVDAPHCLYFDTDAVFLESPAGLFASARAEPDVPLWAARNFPEADFSRQIIHQAPEIAREAPANAGDPEAASPALYFNNGVLLINVDEWRRRGIPDACLALAERHQFTAHDQDALNCVLRGEWRELPEAWNYQLYGRHAIPAGCALLHYSGRNKPWHFGYPSAARQPFRDAVRLAGWPRWRPPANFSQWLRNTRLRPFLAQAQYHMRRALGLPGIKRR